METPHNFQIRPNTQDVGVVYAQFQKNEYRLPDHFSNTDVILDIGAHIGAFAYACLIRGAGMVVCVEPDEDNFRVLSTNMAPFRDRVELMNAAAWRSDRSESITFTGYPPGHTACGSVVPDVTVGSVNERRHVKAVPFDGVVDVGRCLTDHNKRIALCKMDCEGSEWYTLFTSRKLHHIDRIVGEIHDIPEMQLPNDPSKLCVAIHLVELLRSSGFEVESLEIRPRQHLFFASRPKETVPSI